ncbi:MAG: substrate-binding domain-containing protein [Anaerolineaceae bacterium]|nr:substrate-binding domain-containing protein [Anaerolineaceae bacterium]
MSLFKRQVGILILLALLIIANSLYAQDTTEITAVGSAIVLPVLENLTTNAGSDITLNSTVTGTTSGFSQFCQGQVDITAADRPVTAEEGTACQENGITASELVIGTHIIALIANPDVNFVSCLTTADLDTLFAPSAAGNITNWNQVNADYPDLPLTVFAPVQNTVAFNDLDGIVGGDGLRSDAQLSDSATVLSSVENTSGAIGAVPLPDAEAAVDKVQILMVNSNDVVGCQAPSGAAVENRLYDGGGFLILYVNRASLDTVGLSDLIAVVTGPESADTLTSLGLVPPSEEMYTRNIASLAGDETVNQFTADNSTFEIPADVSGVINIAGATVAGTYLTSTIQSFTTFYPGVTITPTLDGESAGFRRLCNGETDMIVTYNGLSDDAKTNCEANNITTFSVDLGSEAVVLLANANTDFLSCLTTEQLTTAWSAASTNTVTTWDQVDSTFPSTDMTLFQPLAGDSTTDLLMIQSAGVDVPARADTQVNRDPLYRAAATANVEGGLTFMSWQDYQRVLANNQANIQLVSVDSGSGCVAPSEQTIANGSYALTRPAQLDVNMAALVRPDIQSFLWYLFMDDNYDQFAANRLTGISFGDLPALRDALQQAFNGAMAAQTAAEITPEATAEPEATVEPEATAEAGN